MAEAVTASALGTLRYYQTIGQGYADMLRGAFTASSFITAGAAWLGMGKAGALMLGAASMGFWIVLAVVFGWVVWKYRVIHNTLEREGVNNPITMRMLTAMEEIATNTRHRHPGLDALNERAFR